MTSTRRTFVIRSLAGAGALAAGTASFRAQAQPAVVDADPQAVGLGYKADGSKTDKTTGATLEQQITKIFAF